MKKKYLIFGLALFLLLGASKVKAETTQTYTSYKAGNRVTVRVNETKKFDFYVIEDSGSENSEITAILYDTSYPTLYNYQEATNAMASYGAEWKNAKEVRFPTLKELLGIDVTITTESSTIPVPNSSYASASHSYWLQESYMNDGHWIIGPSSGVGSGVSYPVNDSTMVGIRPVIIISKDHIDKPDHDNSQTSNGGYTQTVITNVPNTLSNHPYIMMGVASLFVLVGIGFVSHNLNQKKRNQ